MVQSMSLTGLQQASRFQLNLKGWTRSGCKNDEIHALLVPPLHHHPWNGRQLCPATSWLHTQAPIAVSDHG